MPLGDRSKVVDQDYTSIRGWKVFCQEYVMRVEDSKKSLEFYQEHQRVKKPGPPRHVH